jgi:hypothetical protein
VPPQRHLKLRLVQQVVGVGHRPENGVNGLVGAAGYFLASAVQILESYYPVRRVVTARFFQGRKASV